MSTKKKKKHNVIDLFCGAGGLSKGFVEAGFNVLYANDINQDFVESYRANHPNTFVHKGDIKNIKTAQILKATKVNKTEIEIIIGGPPCQGFSTVGKRWFQDGRNYLFKEYFRIVKELSPKIFVFENVTGILSMGGGSVFQEIIRLFSSIGYYTQHKVLNALEFGVPQTRERVFVVGTKKGLPRFSYPKPTHNSSPSLSNSHLKPALTLAEAISDLPLIKAGEKEESYSSKPKNEYQEERRGNNEKLLCHDAPNHGNNLLKVMSFVPEGGSLRDVPQKYRPKTGFPNTYARLWWNKPCTTVTRNFGTPSSSRCIHPKVNRGLTTREGARIQSFDDNFLLIGSRTSKNLQIGNAVPPLFAKAIAKEVQRFLKTI